MAARRRLAATDGLWSLATTGGSSASTLAAFTVVCRSRERGNCMLVVIGVEVSSDNGKVGASIWFVALSLLHCLRP